MEIVDEIEGIGAVASLRPRTEILKMARAAKNPDRWGRRSGVWRLKLGVRVAYTEHQSSRGWILCLDVEQMEGLGPRRAGPILWGFSRRRDAIDAFESYCERGWGALSGLPREERSVGSLAHTRYVSGGRA